MLKSIKNYALHNLLAIDQLFNTILGGYADETLSSRAWRSYAKNKIFGLIFRPTIDLLFFFENDHCYNAYISELRRKQMPSEFQEV